MVLGSYVIGMNMVLHTISLMDLHRQISDALITFGLNFLHFDAVLGKIWPNYRLDPTLENPGSATEFS